MQNKIRFIKDLLWFFVFWGVTAALLRLVFGLGATTNLSDEIPWGLWKVLNMIAGVALSTSGFTIGFLVYVLKIEKLRPLVRPAILVAFLGYGSSCMALMFDIGLPHKFWHPFVMWNEHSFLFEVFWCVIIYFSVTFIELVPNILERFKAERLVKFLHKISIGVVILGISLSSLHHSSLGSLFLTTPYRLHELWYTSMLPWMFIVSAMGCGMMFLILAKILYARMYDPESVFGNSYGKQASSVTCSLDGSSYTKAKSFYGKDMAMLNILAVIAASILGLYLIMKIYDLFTSAALGGLMAGTWESWLYIGELSLTAIIPIIIVAVKGLRRSPYWLGVAAGSSSVGLLLNRMNVGIFGYFRDSGVVYTPSLAEWSLTLAVFAGAALAFIYISENFSIFDDKWKTASVEKGIFQSSFDSLSQVWNMSLNNGLYRVSLLAVAVLPISFIVLYPPYQGEEEIMVIPASGIDVSRSVLLINGNGNDESTSFPHLDHQKRLGEEKSCARCHHISMPNDNSTPCARCHRDMLQKTKIFDHSLHLQKVAQEKNLKGLYPENHTCFECHPKGKAKTAVNAVGCMDCHEKDMKLKNHGEAKYGFKYADSYMDAMHKNCIPCHTKEEERVGKKISECAACHRNMGTVKIAKSDYK